MKSTLVAAIDVGGTAVKTAVIDESQLVLSTASYPLAHLRGTPQIIDEITRICHHTVASARETVDDDVSAVGLVVPGIVDPVGRRGVSSMLLGWHDVDFGALVEAACELPTAVDHDVRTAARAEFRYGAAAGSLTDALFIAVGTGVGAAALIGGHIRTGGHGYGGEIAHLVVDPHGPPCPCGKNGCVETIASGPAIAAAYTSATGTTTDAAGVALAARTGDTRAAAIWQRAATALGTAIATYCEILDPTTVILAGGLAGAGEQLLGPVRRTIRTKLSLPTNPDIALTGLGGRAGLHGAAIIALDLLKVRR